jgi:hypothetical protein
LTELGLYSGCVWSEKGDRGHLGLTIVCLRKSRPTASPTPEARQGIFAGRCSEARADQIKPDEPFASSVGHSYQIDPDLSINNAIYH